MDAVYQYTKIDPWFLVQIEDIVKTESEIKSLGFGGLTAENLRTFKRKGMSDLRIANLMGISQKQLRKHRWDLGVYPVYKRVDTCAAEFETSTAYMYSSYDDECEAISEAMNGMLLSNHSYGIPIANAILTTEDLSQAIARQTEKGRDAAYVAVEMAQLLTDLAPSE